MAPRWIPARRQDFAHYPRNDFHLSTSANVRTPALDNALTEVGADRRLFSADYPFETMAEAASWFDALEIDDADHAKIARGMLKL